MEEGGPNEGPFNFSYKEDEFYHGGVAAISVTDDSLGGSVR